MTTERLNEISYWVQRNGPGNCWTGTYGVPAIMLRELLDEVKRLTTCDCGLPLSNGTCSICNNDE